MGKGNKMTATSRGVAQNSNGLTPKENKPVRTKQQKPD